MKKTLGILICILLGISLLSCRGKAEKEDGHEDLDGAEEVSAYEEDFLDFYYTYDHIHYNAFYQRYRIYEEEGRHMFFHETRQVKDDYGPASEKDTTRKGCFEMTGEEWKEFLGFLSQGEARPRSDSAEAGDAGPWLYLYLKNSDSRGLEFHFSSVSVLGNFEVWCEDMAARDR